MAPGVRAVRIGVARPAGTDPGGPSARLARIRAAGAALLLGAPLAACGPTCAEVAADHAATLAAWPALATPAADDRPGPHVALAVPSELLTQTLEARLRAATAPLDPAAGALGAALRLTSVRLAPAPAGVALALAAEITLPGDPPLILGVGATVDLVPEIRAGAVVLPLDPARVHDVGLRLGPEAAQALASWLHARLPEETRAQTPLALLSLALPPVVEALSSAAWAGLRALLADRLSGPALRWDLPPGAPTPVAVAARLDAAHLVLTASVLGGGAAVSVPPTDLPAGSSWAHTSGPVLAAVGGAAIREGWAPGRFDPEGRPDPAGTLRVLPRWGAEPRPARLQVWRWPDRCLVATLAGRPSARLAPTDGGRPGLELRLTDLSAEAFRAGPLTALAAWWSGAFSEVAAGGLAAAGRVRLAEVPLRWHLEAVALDEAGLRVQGALRPDAGSPTAAATTSADHRRARGEAP